MHVLMSFIYRISSILNLTEGQLEFLSYCMLYHLCSNCVRTEDVSLPAHRSVSVNRSHSSVGILGYGVKIWYNSDTTGEGNEKNPQIQMFVSMVMSSYMH